jgi:CRISPR/Cas system-associated endonuclease Cas1
MMDLMEGFRQLIVDRAILRMIQERRGVEGLTEGRGTPSK